MIRPVLLLVFAAAAAGGQWKQAIRPDHPRLFFNRDTWPAVKARALKEEADTFLAMKARVDELAAQPQATRDYGAQAAEAAFVFLVTGQERYRAQAQALLEQSLAYYRLCHAEKREVNWYSFSRINALAAWDWLYPHLPDEKRRELGAGLLDSIRQEQPVKTRRAYARENWSGPESGFYGTPSLLWYAGLAMYKDRIDDALAEQFLTEGHRLFLRVLEFRSRAAADDGGSASGALNYCLAAYPWAEFNFFHTFKSATGLDIARDWPYVAYLPSYIFWNWLPGDREFGYGDAYHTTNRMPLNELNLHLSQIIQFYAASKPDCAAFARWLAARTRKESRAAFPFARFLLTAMPDVAPAVDPEKRMPLARHFENMGQTFFRSGSGPDDTYAMFTAGGVLEQHKQFDHNHFVIYRKGFLAIDTGTRPEPGQHLTHYYSRTVAHNCILIHMPGEQMPRYWGNRAPEEEDLPVPNDGGQRKTLGSRVVAFETNRDFAYSAGDATATYHEQKCRLALRQFVFLPPNHFVVFDRVESVRPEYKKTWLLHTVNEPVIRDHEFSAVHEEGKLIARTVLPEKVALEKIGGPGKQFWSGGRNWPLPKGYRTPDTTPLLGQWRVEVSPAGDNAAELFLHVIQVGDASLAGMDRVRLLRRGDLTGVRIDTRAGVWEVLFGVEGPPSGRIRRTGGGRAPMDRELTREVMPQAGLYGDGL